MVTSTALVLACLSEVERQPLTFVTPSFGWLDSYRVQFQLPVGYHAFFDDDTSDYLRMTDGKLSRWATVIVTNGEESFELSIIVQSGEKASHFTGGAKPSSRKVTFAEWDDELYAYVPTPRDDYYLVISRTGKFGDRNGVLHRLAHSVKFRRPR